MDRQRLAVSLLALGKWFVFGILSDLGGKVAPGFLLYSSHHRNGRDVLFDEGIFRRRHIFALRDSSDL